MTKRLKLYTEYGAGPLWRLEGDGTIESNQLPLSRETIAALEAWQDTYDATLNWDSPGDGDGFVSEEAEQLFDKEGIRLWKQLIQELPQDYEIYYKLYYGGTGHLLKHPDELPPKFRE